MVETKRLRQLPLHLEKRKAVKWRVKMMEGSEDAVVAVEDSEGAVGFVEASADLDSVEDTGEEGRIQRWVPAAAELEEQGEDSVEATTEERAMQFLAKTFKFVPP